MNSQITTKSRKKGIEEKQDFADALEVVNYLLSNGWRLSLSTFYRHRSDGKIRPQVDGGYSLQAVKKYGRLFLRRRDASTVLAKRATEIIDLVAGDEGKVSDLIAWFHRTLR